MSSVWLDVTEALGQCEMCRSLYRTDSGTAGVISAFYYGAGMIEATPSMLATKHLPWTAGLVDKWALSGFMLLRDMLNAQCAEVCIGQTVVLLV